MVSHYLGTKPIELGAGDLSSRVLTSEAISESGQYNSNMEYLTVFPKHIKLPSNKEYCKGIAVLEIPPSE